MLRTGKVRGYGLASVNVRGEGGDQSLAALRLLGTCARTVSKDDIIRIATDRGEDWNAPAPVERTGLLIVRKEQ